MKWQGTFQMWLCGFKWHFGFNYENWDWGGNLDKSPKASERNWVDSIRGVIVIRLMWYQFFLKCNFTTYTHCMHLQNVMYLISNIVWLHILSVAHAKSVLISICCVWHLYCHHQSLSWIIGHIDTHFNSLSLFHDHGPNFKWTDLNASFVWTSFSVCVTTVFWHF